MLLAIPYCTVLTLRKTQAICSGLCRNTHDIFGLTRDTCYRSLSDVAQFMYGYLHFFAAANVRTIPNWSLISFRGRKRSQRWNFMWSKISNAKRSNDESKVSSEYNLHFKFLRLRFEYFRREKSFDWFICAL